MPRTLASGGAPEGTRDAPPPGRPAVVSVLLATLGQPERAETCVRSLRATTKGYNVELVIERRPGGMAQAWNEALRRATGDPLVLAADDLVFRDGWLRAALRELAAFPDGWGFVGFNDGHFGEELSTHFLVSRRLIREAFEGVIAWENDTDVEACARARAAGRYAWCSDAHVDHADWRFGDRPR